MPGQAFIVAGGARGGEPGDALPFNDEEPADVFVGRAYIEAGDGAVTVETNAGLCAETSFGDSDCTFIAGAQDNKIRCKR